MKYPNRAEILAEIGKILTEELAAGEWGRLLVEIVRHSDGEPIVANVDVEEIFGDEQKVDHKFGADSVRVVLPVLAKATEALCTLDGVELEDVRGGTFVRRQDGGFAWLAGLVRTPSARFDRERDALVAKLQAKNGVLAESFGVSVGTPCEVDLAKGSIRFAPNGRPRAEARAILIGTFATAVRTWGWGGSNPHVPEATRSASAALVDGILDRDIWELSSPAFATDEGTAWALAALVCDRAGGDGVLQLPQSVQGPELPVIRSGQGEQGGSAFFLLREVSRREGRGAGP